MDAATPLPAVAPGEAPSEAPGETLTETRAETRASAPAEERGRTHIDSRVVERIAAAAVAETDGVVVSGRRLFGVSLGGRDITRVQAAVTGTRATVRTTVALAYPVPVREVTRRLQRHVSDRVGQLTGLRVGSVDVQVRALAPEAAARVR